MKILKETEEYPIAGDNEKTLEIVNDVVMCRYIPQYLYIVTKYYLVLFGFKFLLHRKSTTKNYFKLDRCKI